MPKSICSFDPCERPSKSLGLCAAHWQQQYDGRGLQPIQRWSNDMGSLKESIEERLDKTDGESGCWVWSGMVNQDGYGLVKIRGKRVMVHRAYLQETGVSIPEGLTVDHLCRNRACANPDHLELVTNLENVMRGFSPPAVNARKTECKRGHPFDAVNTYVAPNGNRACKECRRMHLRKWRSKSKVVPR